MAGGRIAEQARMRERLRSPAPRPARDHGTEREAQRLGPRLGAALQGKPTAPIAVRASPQSATGLVPSTERATRSLRGTGNPLPSALQRRAEIATGASLAGVRIHVGSAADMLARASGAPAVTFGQDIAFARGVAPTAKTLGHELVHAIQQRGRVPVIETYVDPRGDKLAEAVVETQSDDDLKKMESEAIAALDGTAPLANRANVDWNLALVQAQLIKRGKPFIARTESKYAANPADQASTEQVEALRVRVEVIKTLATAYFGNVGAPLVARLDDLSKRADKLHKDSILDEGDRLELINIGLSLAHKTLQALPSEAPVDPKVASAYGVYIKAIHATVRDLGTPLQSLRVTEQKQAGDGYIDVFSVAVIDALKQAKDLIQSKDAEPPDKDDIMVRGYGTAIRPSFDQRDTYAQELKLLRKDIAKLGDLGKLRGGSLAERAKFLDGAGKRADDLLRRAQALAIMRSAFTAGSVLLDKTLQQTYQATKDDAFLAGDIRNMILVPLANELFESNLSGKTLADAQRRLGNAPGPIDPKTGQPDPPASGLWKDVETRFKDVSAFQQRFGYFTTFAAMALSMYGGAIAMRAAVGSTTATGGTLTIAQLVRGSLMFSSTSMLINAGLTGHVPTPKEQAHQYAMDLATFGLLHGIGMGLSARYGGPLQVPPGVKMSAEFGALWTFTASVGLAQHLDKGGHLSGKDALAILGDATTHTALGIMAAHVGGHLAEMPKLKYHSPNAPAQLAIGEYNRVRENAKNLSGEIEAWNKGDKSSAKLDELMVKAEKIYGEFRSAVKGMETTGILDAAQAKAILDNVRGLQSVRNVRDAGRLGVRSSGQNAVAYSGDVRNLDLFLRRLQREGTVSSFEPIGRAGMYRVQQSDGSWAVWYPEGPAPESGKLLDLAGEAINQAYPDVPAAKRATVLANLSRLPVAEANKIIGALTSADGRPLLDWMARKDVGSSRFLSADLLNAFVRDPAFRDIVSKESPDNIQRWFETPFEKIYGDRSGASFVRFLNDVLAYRGKLEVADRAQALAVGGDVMRTSEGMKFKPEDVRYIKYVTAHGTPTPGLTPREVVKTDNQQLKLGGEFIDVHVGRATYVVNVQNGRPANVWVFTPGAPYEIKSIELKVGQLRDGIAAADALSDSTARQNALDALKGLAGELAFLREVRGVPVADIVPLLDRVSPRAASPLPDVAPPEPAAIPAIDRVPITHAEARRQRRQELLDRAERMGMKRDRLVEQLRDWDPDIADPAKRPANPDALLKAVEIYLNDIRQLRVKNLLQPTRFKGCFVAGTEVALADDAAGIETLATGDRVTIADPTTSELAHAVVCATATRSSPTLRLRCAGVTVETTGEHPFWRPGIGWVRAGLLASGDTVWSARHGTLTIDAIEAGPIATVHNLEVAGAHTFLVGPFALLVHNKALPALSHKLKIISVPPIDPTQPATEHTFRWGGNTEMERELKKAGVYYGRTADPTTGLRTWTFEVTDPVTGKVENHTLRERGQYDDIRIDMSPGSAEAAPVEKLFTDFGIVDPEVKMRVVEAIEFENVRSPGLTRKEAIKRVREILDEAQTNAAARSTAAAPVTAEQVLKAQGKVPLVSAKEAAQLAAAQKLDATKVFAREKALSARTPEEVASEAFKPHAVAEVEAQAIARKLPGGKTITDIQFIGDVYADAAMTGGPHRIDVDVTPDIDAAWVSEASGTYTIEYMLQQKIKGASGAKEAADQNAQASAAITSGGKLYKTKLHGVERWVKVKRVFGTDATTGAQVELTGKLATTAPIAETQGASGARGYDRPMTTTYAEAQAQAWLLFRIREVSGR